MRGFQRAQDFERSLGDPFSAPPFPNNMSGSGNNMSELALSTNGFSKGNFGQQHLQQGSGEVQYRLDQMELELLRLKHSGPSPTMKRAGSASRLERLAPLNHQPMVSSGYMPQMAPPPPHQQVMHMPVPWPMGGGGGSGAYMDPNAGGAPAGGGFGHDAVVSLEHSELMLAHKNLLDVIKAQQESHSQLLKAHTDLMAAHMQLTTNSADGPLSTKPKVKPPSLGVVRLDYNYPAAEGDMDCPASFGYDVFYRVVPGLTFEMCQAGKFTQQVERNFAEAIKFLEQRGVCGITGDCGFMMAFQVVARKIAKAPVFMSAMVQCPIIAASLDPSHKILILTANSLTLKPQKDLLLSHCGFDVCDDRFIIVGCQDVPGFDAVSTGGAVPLDKVQGGIMKLVGDVIKKHKDVWGILLECTELPPYADALRYMTKLPVWDCITAADFYMSAYKDNSRFGVDSWQEHWDGVQEEYNLGMNLVDSDLKQMEHKVDIHAKHPKNPPQKFQVDKLQKGMARKQAPVLGILRLDYNYPPSAGDVDSPASFGYECKMRTVPGLTFEMAQSGKMTPTVEKEFKDALHWLEDEGCVGITGDCGFMMAFQPISRATVNIPCFMSSMLQCPMISLAFDKFEKVIILTANSATLLPQKEILLSHCGFDVDDDRFIIVGCQDVDGFDAVAKSEKVDVARVTPGIVAKVQKLIKMVPSVAGIVLECTELGPYSDAIRQHTGLPVWDPITNCDFFINSFEDNPRFGMNQWQNDWDGHIEEYKLGDHLSAAERAKLLNGAQKKGLV